ncbi:MAG TPA: sugar ABC transporter permease [Firmicutes bacterium]|nr:sugar ABC transporter permease [Bacillota bacterium]
MQKKPVRIFLEILTIILFIIFLLPFVLIIINAAKSNALITTDPLALPESFGNLWENVKLIWTSENVQFQQSLWSSLIITVTSLFFITIFSAMGAWVLVRTKTKISNIIFLLFVGAMVIPFQVVMFPLVSWFRTITEVTGIPMLRDYIGMIFAYIGFGAPLSIFLFHGFIKSIPYELEEAAEIDGCNKVQTFFYIVMPILKPIYITVLILNGIWIWNDFLLPLLILGKGNSIQTIPLAVANFVGAFVRQWDLILTAALMAMVPIIILFLFAQKHIIKGMVEGSIK